MLIYHKAAWIPCFCAFASALTLALCSTASGAASCMAPLFFVVIAVFTARANASVLSGSHHQWPGFSTKLRAPPLANAINTTVEQFWRAALYFSVAENFIHQAFMCASFKPLGIASVAGALSSYSVSFCNVWLGLGRTHSLNYNRIK